VFVKLPFSKLEHPWYHGETQAIVCYLNRHFVALSLCRHFTSAKDLPAALAADSLLPRPAQLHVGFLSAVRNSVPDPAWLTELLTSNLHDPRVFTPHQPGTSSTSQTSFCLAQVKRR
jgi:hypothetical protein